MPKFNSEGMTAEEIIETLKGREITFTNHISDREDTAIIRSDAPDPQITDNDRGRVIRFFSPEGVRFVQIEKIFKYGRKKH